MFCGDINSGFSADTEFLGITANTLALEAMAIPSLIFIM
ncbi:MAG: hypothetical protein ACI9DO_000118 [Reinekea sp.]|jgi:hypothetical protein